MAAKEGIKPEKIPAGMKLKHTLKGHSNLIRGLAWSPDGVLLASASEDKTIRIWNTETGELYKTLTEHQREVQSLSWSPDGKILTSGSIDKTICLWDGKKGRLLNTIKKHKNSVSSISWSPKGQTFASISRKNDPTICIWKALANELPHELKGHKSNIRSIAWSPDGKILASGSRDKTIRIWDPINCELIRVIKGHTHFINSVSWSPAGNILASGSNDNTIRIWDVKTGRQLNIIEGHTRFVYGVLFSPDGALLASQSYDQTTRLWRCDTWEPVAIIDEPTQGAWGGLAFHPHLPLLATRGEENRIIRIWELDYHVLLGKATAAKSVTYTNAKVVLMGETSTGKTCIARALMGEPFVPQESTHGMKVWDFQSKKEKQPGGGEITRETFLWDLAGQTDYQVVHQLFLDETALGVVLFDPTHPEKPFAGVDHWEKTLKKIVGDDCPRVLVAGRVDRGAPTVTDGDIQAFLKEHGFSGYVATSAKTGQGIKELHNAIIQSIPWDKLPVTRSPELWKKIREYLLKRRKGRNVLTGKSDLQEAFGQKYRKDFTGADFDTVISHAQAQGLVWRFSFGDFVLLQPEILNDYASAIVRAARKHPNGLGTVCEQELLQANIDFEDLTRLADPATERSLLHAVVELFLNRQVALRESGQVVFPSKFNRKLPQYPKPPARQVAYSFSGAVEEIYATLVVRLFYSGAFELKDLYKNAAEFRDAIGCLCGFILTSPHEGDGIISIFFEDQTSMESKVLFLRFIHEHLFRHTLTDSVDRERIYRCPACKEEVENKRAIKKRLKDGKPTITCVYCDIKIPLFDLLEEKFGNPDLLEKVREMEEEAEEKKDEAVGITTSKAKAHIGEFDVFLAHNSKDKDQVIKLSERLKAHGLNPWLDIEQIPPGRWFQDIISQDIQKVKSAAIIIGKHGIGKWENLELRAFISRCVDEDIPVIPILLPGVSKLPSNLSFLRELNWVKFKEKIEDSEALDNLEWGITGKKPQRGY
ncbi:MAG: TIR domain-containing protein [Candidatus Aminicenantes bacterium]